MYYEQRGWDSNGIPTPQTLESLGLQAEMALRFEDRRDYVGRSAEYPKGLEDP